jgi:hypothetical protein
MEENQDTQAYFYEPVTARNERNSKRNHDRAPEDGGNS